MTLFSADQEQSFQVTALGSGSRLLTATFSFCTQPSSQNKPICCNGSMLSVSLLTKSGPLFQYWKEKWVKGDLNLVKSSEDSETLIGLSGPVVCLDTVIVASITTIEIWTWDHTHTHKHTNLFSFLYIVYPISCLTALFFLVLTKNNILFHSNWFLYC